MATKAGPKRLSNAWRRVHSTFADEISAQFARHVPRKSSPHRLYHFTDCDGLIGILRDKTIWASLATSLNDRSETQHGVSLVRNLIQEQKVRAKWLPLDRLDATLNQPQSWRHYVISFCGRSDTALHWLHYGRSGSGVAIGFDSRALKRAARRQQFKLYPVLYKEERQQARLESVVNTVDRILGRKLRQLTRRLDRHLLVDVALELVTNEVWRVAPRMKAPVFEPELEWRLLASIPMGGVGVPAFKDPTGSTSFRPAAGRVMPYKQLRFDVLPAVEIVMGSSAPLRQDLLALQVLMEETLGAAIKLSDSPVPVRP